MAAGKVETKPSQETIRTVLRLSAAWAQLKMSLDDRQNSMGWWEVLSSVTAADEKKVV